MLGQQETCLCLERKVCMLFVCFITLVYVSTYSHPSPWGDKRQMRKIELCLSFITMVCVSTYSHPSLVRVNGQIRSHFTVSPLYNLGICLHILTSFPDEGQQTNEELLEGSLLLYASWTIVFKTKLVLAVSQPH